MPTQTTYSLGKALARDRCGKMRAGPAGCFASAGPVVMEGLKADSGSLVRLPESEG